MVCEVRSFSLVFSKKIEGVFGHYFELTLIEKNAPGTFKKLGQQQSGSCFVCVISNEFSLTVFSFC